MNKLPIDASEKEIKDIIIEWNELMAQERYAEALELVPYDTNHYYNDSEWTPELLKSVVYGYGLAGYTKEELEKEFGCIYKITSLNNISNRNEIIQSIEINYDMEWFEENDLAEILYDVPLNGSQSDLTASFILRRVNDKYITVIFEDLHVM